MIEVPKYLPVTDGPPPSGYVLRWVHASELAPILKPSAEPEPYEVYSVESSPASSPLSSRSASPVASPRAAPFAREALSVQMPNPSRVAVSETKPQVPTIGKCTTGSSADAGKANPIVNGVYDYGLLHTTISESSLSHIFPVEDNISGDVEEFHRSFMKSLNIVATQFLIDKVKDDVMLQYIVGLKKERPHFQQPLSENASYGYRLQVPNKALVMIQHLKVEFQQNKLKNWYKVMYHNMYFLKHKNYDGLAMTEDDFSAIRKKYMKLQQLYVEEFKILEGKNTPKVVELSTFLESVLLTLFISTQVFSHKQPSKEVASAYLTGLFNHPEGNYNYGRSVNFNGTQGGPITKLLIHLHNHWCS